MLSTLIICLGSLSIVACGLVAAEDHWEKFAETFDKEYTQQELGLRKQLLAKSVRKISEHNVNADLGLSSYRLGVNEYSDSSDEEYDRMNGLVLPANATLGGSTFLTPENVPVPDAVDWRQHGYVTGVKNQGSCGSCWAFSSTGVLEGQHYRRYRKLVSLSEQELVDCSRAFGNYGCHGGWTVSAYHYIAQNGGLDGETCYPYENRDAKCRFRRECVLANCTMNHVLIQPGDETALEVAVATVGPISAGIDARHDAFRHYKSGILDIPACTTRLTHYVLIVGYGRENGLDYWLVKNSFGTSWGIKGYVKMIRNKNNQCGIASRSTYPLL